METATRVPTDGGPDKFDMGASLMAGNGTKKRPRSSVTIILMDNSEIEGYFDALEREDGSGQNWLYKFFVLQGHYKTGNRNLSGMRLNGYYSLIRRQGWIEIPNRD